MRRSRFFCETLRQNPAESEAAGHQLLVRGGYMQPLAAGIYSLLPLGRRVSTRLEAILREEMDALGGQEVQMPIVQPADLWQRSGRFMSVGAELARFRDRGEREMVLAMTHEEVVADLLAHTIRSYRQLPVLLYQIQTKFRDEPRSRGGLIRAREFTMKDAYSAHAGADGLDAFYPRMVEAYERIFARLALPVITVQSDVGMMGGSAAHEFMFLTEIGEDTLALCDACGYRANRQVATFAKGTPAHEEILPLEEVATPETATIAALADLLRVPAERTAKALFFMAGERLIFAVVRGDMEANETKLANAVGAVALRPARLDELAGTGIVPGYASPIGISGATVVVDDLVAASPNLIAGANRAGYHLRNTNVGRDFQPDIVADIANAQEGAPCAVCGAPLRLVRAVEVGNTFKLGTRYAEALGARYLDSQGTMQPIVMGSYGIGVGRLMACLAEHWRDERGLIWPAAAAPFAIYLVGLDLEDETVRAAADDLYDRLERAGLAVLYDDRDERAGVKFNDADLLGIPLRVTVGRRALRNEAAEVKRRSGGDAWQIPLAEAVSALRLVLAEGQGAASAHGAQ